MTEQLGHKRAVALLSGGLDSATCLAIAVHEGYEVFTVCFDYGQRHRVEMESAKSVSLSMGATSHKVISVDLGSLGGSALTDEIEVPKLAPDTVAPEGIPVTYVPARNTVFLSLALAYAETLGTGDIFIGVNALDYSGYPDCRPEYIEAYERMANLATKAAVEDKSKVRIHAPLVHMTKKQIIETGSRLGVDYSLTVSCYDPDDSGKPCRRCESCRLRAKGFEQAGMVDPAYFNKRQDC